MVINKPIILTTEGAVIAPVAIVGGDSRGTIWGKTSIDGTTADAQGRRGYTRNFCADGCGPDRGLGNKHFVEENAKRTVREGI